MPSTRFIKSTWRAGNFPRSVTSRAIFDAPVIWPCAFLIGETGQRNIDRAAALALANGFVMFYLLAATDASKKRRLLIMSFRWNTDRNGFADDVFGGVAEERLAALGTVNQLLITRAD
jgi:hypothetical protein